MPEIPDLWPDIVEVEQATPISILKAQATALGEKTNRLLEGETKTRATSVGGFEHTFYIYAPTLSYRVQVLAIRHGLDFYPIEAKAWDETPSEPIVNEQQFLEWLKAVFSKNRTKKAIQSLLAQTKSA
jgi:hypothetical protein